MDDELLRVEDLTKSFRVEKGAFGEKVRTVDAVKKTSFSIMKGETLGLVGESGCGKSTIGKMIIGMYAPSSGSIYLNSERISPAQKGSNRVKSRLIQMIFQNPYASLDPKMTLMKILEEPLVIQGYSKESRAERVQELLEYVGFGPSLLERHPRELSGGQKQRIAIARALAVKPSFLVLDEPVSALDVSIQAQILNLLVDLQQELDLTYLFISHDLGVVQYISDRVSVMYLGQIVEMADCQRIYENPLHPYTRLLVQSVPVPDPHYKQATFTSEPIDLTQDTFSAGCQFCSRCPDALDICNEEEPGLMEISQGHIVRCHLYAKPHFTEETALSN